MTIELPPPQTRALNQLLKSGAYSSPAEVLAEGLRLLQSYRADRAKVRAAIRRDILAGVKQIRARRMRPFDDSAVARITAQGQKLLANGKRSRRSRAA
jgi:Arc/MetJ-type ribon-helix-helix transcriptional regulator